MRKVIVIGCPGAGKSTFAKELHRRSGLPLFHLDMIWHKPDKTNISREEFDCKLAEILRQDAWIIDGNYGRTMETRIAACDTVFLLDLPVDVCLAGAQERIGRKREDMPWVENTLDPEFRQWIVDFAAREMPHVRRLLEKVKDKQIVTFSSREQIDMFWKKEW